MMVSGFGGGVDVGRRRQQQRIWIKSRLARKISDLGGRGMLII